MKTPAEKYGLPKPHSDWGRDGNAYAIMGNVRNALKRAGYPAEALTEYGEESTSGDYDHLLQTAMLWCDIDQDEDDEDDEYEEDDLLTCENCGLEEDVDHMEFQKGRWLCWECAQDERTANGEEE